MTDSLKHIVGKSDSIGITDAEVAKIAGALTKAQREAVKKARLILLTEERELHWRNRWDTKVILSLIEKGVAERCGISRARLTPFGLSVRVHLATGART